MNIVVSYLTYTAAGILGFTLAAIMAATGRGRYVTVEGIAWCEEHGEVSFSHSDTCLGRIAGEGCDIVPVFVEADHA